jgi:hypothetical protein
MFINGVDDEEWDRHKLTAEKVKKRHKSTAERNGVAW